MITKKQLKCDEESKNSLAQKRFVQSCMFDAFQVDIQLNKLKQQGVQHQHAFYRKR